MSELRLFYCLQIMIMDPSCQEIGTAVPGELRLGHFVKNIMEIRNPYMRKNLLRLRWHR